MATKRKILTLVLLSGCGTTSTSSQDRQPTGAPAISNVPAIPMVAAAAAPAPTPAAATPATPVADHLQPEARIELRAALYGSDPDLALSNPGRFRALCDAEGYPLVGNVANKGPMFTVGEYCASVRTTLAKSNS